MAGAIGMKIIAGLKLLEQCPGRRILYGSRHLCNTIEKACGANKLIQLLSVFVDLRSAIFQ